MNTPIFPQVVYPIGDLPDGMFYGEVTTRGFRYLRDLPEFDYDESGPPTLRDTGPPTLRDEDVQSLIEQPPPLPYLYRAA